MISLKTLHRSNAAKAGHYYADQKDDYYSRDGSSAQWQGQGAQLLGLSGEVNQKQFTAALKGDFGPGVKLAKSVRKDAKSRAGEDLTFSAPESVSIQALVGKDSSVLEAHDYAVRKTLEYLENELVRARQKVDGMTRSEQTANIVAAKFRHETARPSRSDPADPQLHTHAIIMNVTQRADGTWVALANEQIYKNKKLLDTIYKSEMAAQLEKASYALRYEKDGFEMAHISREQIELFSKRGMTVEAELAIMGKTRQTASHDLKQTITLATRSAKRPEISREALQQQWEKEAQKTGIDFMAAKRPIELSKHDHDKSPPGTQRTPVNGEDLNPDHPTTTYKPEPHAVSAQLQQNIADHCVTWAIRHHGERESVIRASVLEVLALNHSMGTGISHTHIKQAIEQAVTKGHLIKGAPVYRSNDVADTGTALSQEQWIKRLVREDTPLSQARQNVRRAIATGSLILDEVRYTSQAAREREKRIIQIEREGRGKVAPILSPQAIKEQMAGKGLRPGQLSAADLVLSTNNSIVGVQGLAGVGKSFMLKQVKAAIESADYKVKSVAPYGAQVKELRSLGVETVTVASMLEAKQGRFRLDSKTVLVVDESGVVPARQMEKILKKAENAGARVVMMGDKDQTKAIEAGRPMHQLQDEGMSTALMGDIVRQTNPLLRDAVVLAAKGQASEALHILQSKLEAVNEIQDDTERYAAMADQYVTLDAQDQQETLIITGTNKSRNELNDLVHARLGFEGKGFKYDLLTRVDTTQAQRRSARYFKKDSIIQPERDYGNGLKAGNQYKVSLVDTSLNRVEVTHLQTGEVIKFNPSRTTKLSIYELRQSELSAGDKVRITRNNAALDLVNGERYSVIAVTPLTISLGKVANDGSITKRITLDADQKNPLHLDYAYASTVHSAQGLTATRVILNQETYSRTAKSDVFYVAISRAKEKVSIYTENMTKLPFAVNRREEKGAALDIGMTRSSRQTEITHEHSVTQSTPDELSL
ncbi:MobF family relaxase [Neopusillimonas maritima]|jgi:conjugative relaxase-like TrwC/TraI family protein|uniref:TrwC protein n=1 Tax=Neopusillimonas maritima TaxID=2026239 RepID=A0ABX9MV41_9BURK|nr:MobF family relaxase [Neopusillimonas maritima]RII82805.1 TrwC protein [Neopusillimonas maritima]